MPETRTNTSKFALGQIVATPGASDVLQKSAQSPAEFLARHVACDWGEVCDEDAELNNQSLVDGSRILSAYSTVADEKIWIITEADRSSTCLLLPSEY